MVRVAEPAISSIGRAGTHEVCSLAAPIRRRFDAVVIGAGPAGASAAIELAQGGLRVLVVASGDKAVRVGECLPAAAKPVLHRLKLATTVALHAACAGTRSSWQDDELMETSSIFNPYGHGWRLDRRQFETDLIAQIAACGAEIWSPAHFLRAERSKSGWTLAIRKVAQTVNVEAGLVVDCSGRKSTFARAQGARRRMRDAMTAALLVLPQAEGDDDTMLTVEAAPYGWWYTVALPEGGRVAALMTDTDVLRQLGARRLELWVELLRGTRHVGSYYGIERTGDLKDPVLAPANSIYNTAVCGPGWAAAGDAACSFDPLSSHGLLSALVTGRTAAECLLKDTEAARNNYTERIRATYANYLIDYSRYYCLNLRWIEEAFWSRRKSGYMIQEADG